MKSLSTPKPSGKVPYRQDINGMRAWAVIVVLLFHFKIPGISAGFVGVDVFFVISGFLMAAIIVKGLEANNFSIWQFYLARIRRIMPALMVLIGVLLALGWFFLPTPYYQALGSESASALGFLSNIYFWRSAGYFDAAAQEKWLLHTWSLGIEFQFYILFPVFFLVLWKIKPQIKTLFLGLVLAFLASLALSIFVSHFKPTAAFYLLPTRGWELAAGGLAFLVGREVPSLKRFAKAMFWIGFVLWLIAVFVIDDTFAWPSGWALLPVLGTVLIILSPQANSRLMLHPLAQWFGDRSYSLYLWHWPLVVALYLAGLQDDWRWIVGAFLMSLFLGNLSYWFVEKPTSKYLTALCFGKQIVIIMSAAVAIGAVAVSAKMFSFGGRLSAEVEVAAAETNNKDPRLDECFRAATGKGSPGCTYGQPSISAILMGDSHAGSVATGLGDAASKHGQGVLFWGMTSCPTLDNLKYSDKVKRPTHICNELNQWAFKELEKHTDVPLVLVSRTSGYLMGPNEPDKQKDAERISIYFSKLYSDRNDPDYIDEFQSVLTETACRLAKNRDVYLMRPVPEYGVSVPSTLSRNIFFRGDSRDMRITLTEYHQRNKLVWEAQDSAAKQCGIKILNPLPYLCDGEYCYGSRNGRPLYHDDNHLSQYGSRFLAPMFEQVFLDQKQ